MRHDEIGTISLVSCYNSVLTFCYKQGEIHRGCNATTILWFVVRRGMREHYNYQSKLYRCW